MDRVKKISVTLYPKLIDGLNDRRGRQSLSAQIDEDLNSYLNIIDHGIIRARNKLTRKEASLLLHALTTTQWGKSDLHDMIELGITRKISEVCCLRDKDLDFGVDFGLLNKRINEMSQLERLALLDLADVLRHKGDTTSLDEALAKFPEKIDERQPD